MSFYMYEDGDCWSVVEADDEKQALGFIYEIDLNSEDGEMMQVSPVTLHEFTFGPKHKMEFELTPPQKVATLEIGKVTHY